MRPQLQALELGFLEKSEVQRLIVRVIKKSFRPIGSVDFQNRLGIPWMDQFEWYT